jgi:phage antirepressor YoqD-like protein
MYLTNSAADAYMNNPELFAEMAKRCTALERKVDEMEHTLNERYPVYVLGEVVMAQTGSIPFKDGAAFLSQHGVPTGQNRLFKYCREKKLLCSCKGKQWNRLTQKAIDAGLFNVEISGGFNAITMITPAGLKYLTDELIAQNYPLLAKLEGR